MRHHRSLLPLLLVTILGACDPGESLAPDSPEELASDDSALLLLDPCFFAGTTDIKVPSQCSTLQKAVNRASSGAVIRVAAGWFSENVVVAGKDLTIVGAGSGATVVNGASSASPTFSVGVNTRLTLQDLAITGGSEAVRGRRDASGVARQINLVRAAVWGSPYGVSGDVTFLRSEDSTFSYARQGLALASVQDARLVRTSVYANSEAGAELRVAPGLPGCWIVVSGGSYSDNAGVGLQVRGSACSVDVYGARFARNRKAGVSLQDAGVATISACVIEGTMPAVDGAFGDGVHAWATDVTLAGNTVRGNARAGASIFGCDQRSRLALAGDTLTCHGFDLDVEGTSPQGACDAGASMPSMADLGGNHCYDCAGVEHGCRASSSALLPIPL